MGISSDLQRVIVARLKAEVAEVAGRVYDNPPEGTQRPYISIGPSYWHDDSAECVRARVETVQVDIWAARAPDMRVVKDVTDAVVTALDGWADQGVLTMHPMQVTLVRVMADPDGVSLHGIAQVEARTEG